jgi:hypothetical protein
MEHDNYITPRPTELTKGQAPLTMALMPDPPGTHHLGNWTVVPISKCSTDDTHWNREKQPRF